MAGMKLRHAAAMAPVVWCLMRPPLPHLNRGRGDADNPLSNWVTIQTFPTRKECESRLRGSRWNVCVASDDPRLGQGSLRRNHLKRR